MIRGFDDLTSTLKQIYVMMTKAIGDTKVKYIYGLIKLSWWLQKGKTIVFRSYVIGHKFINPIDEYGV